MCYIRVKQSDISRISFVIDGGCLACIATTFLMSTGLRLTKDVYNLGPKRILVWFLAHNNISSDRLRSHIESEVSSVELGLWLFILSLLAGLGSLLAVILRAHLADRDRDTSSELSPLAGQSQVTPYAAEVSHRSHQPPQRSVTGHTSHHGGQSQVTPVAAEVSHRSHQSPQRSVTGHTSRRRGQTEPGRTDARRGDTAE